MTAEARFVPRARLDLIGHAEYLLEEAGPDLCDRFLDAARLTADHLVETPRIGRVWRSGTTDFDTSLRVWQVEGFPKMLLFYRVEESGVSVVRVLHSARDLPHLLDGYT